MAYLVQSTCTVHNRPRGPSGHSALSAECAWVAMREWPLHGHGNNGNWDYSLWDGGKFANIVCAFIEADTKLHMDQRFNLLHAFNFTLALSLLQKQIASFHILAICVIVELHMVNNGARLRPFKQTNLTDQRQHHSVHFSVHHCQVHCTCQVTVWRHT